MKVQLPCYHVVGTGIVHLRRYVRITTFLRENKYYQCFVSCN